MEQQLENLQTLIGFGIQLDHFFSIDVTKYQIKLIGDLTNYKLIKYGKMGFIFNYDNTDKVFKGHLDTLGTEVKIYLFIL